jgi:hypothetical protein
LNISLCNILGSAAALEGSLLAGDYVLAVNKTSLRNATPSHLALFANPSSTLAAQSNVTLSFVPSTDALVYRQSAVIQLAGSAGLESINSFDSLENNSLVEAVGSTTVISVRAETIPASDEIRRDPDGQGVPPGQKSSDQEESSPSAGSGSSSSSSSPQLWGPERVVLVHREPNRGLGISIVGGKVDVENSSANGGGVSFICGIFIKNVLGDSPAGVFSMHVSSFWFVILHLCSLTTPRSPIIGQCP